MRAEIEALVDAARQSLGVLKRHLDVDAATRRLAELNEKAEDPNLWDDTEAAQKIMRERTELDEKLGSMRKIGIDLDDAITLIELGEAESDQDVIAEGEQAIRAIQTDLVRQQVETLLSGEADQNDCFVEVHSGAGGTESQDWASMLMRMYSRWGERRRYKVEIMDIADGEEAGIKGATLQIRGHNAYGWLKTEAGFRRSTPMRAVIPALHRSRCFRLLMTASRSTSTKAIAGSIPSAPRVRVASTSTPPIRPSASPIFPPGWS